MDAAPKTIVLYGVPVSAFVAKVRIVLDLKGLSYREAPPPDGYGSAAYRTVVPAGSVPGLVMDGQPLHDSNAIVEYLDDIVPEPPLRPTGPMDRARMRALLGFHDTRVEAATRVLFPLIKQDWRSQPERVADGIQGIIAALDRLGDLIEPAPYAFGAAPGLADLAYPPTLQMAEMLATELGATLPAPKKISDWRDRVAQEPAVARSLSIHRGAMENWMAGFRT